MQFIRNAFKGHSDTRMLEAVLSIADMLYLPTVAEGVESAERLQALRSMGCDVIQGYYFSKPIPAEAYERFIEDRLNHPEEHASVELSHHRPRLSCDEYSFDELHDPLTGLYNLTAFNMLVKDADQYHTALLVAEVLEEKRLLSEQGQIAAARTLRHVGDLIKRSFRPVDHVCRISNAKFSIVMSRADSSLQGQVAQKINQINDTLGEPGAGQPAVSLAVGVAIADRVDPRESILADAEKALDGLMARGEKGCAIYK